MVIAQRDVLETVLYGIGVAVRQQVIFIRADIAANVINLTSSQAS